MARNYIMGQDELKFIVFLIHQLSESWHMPSNKVYDILQRKGILDDYIIPCYDVLHTLGSQCLVEDINEFVKERGGF